MINALLRRIFALRKTILQWKNAKADHDVACRLRLQADGSLRLGATVGPGYVSDYAFDKPREYCGIGFIETGERVALHCIERDASGPIFRSVLVVSETRLLRRSRIELAANQPVLRLGRPQYPRSVMRSAFYR